MPRYPSSERTSYCASPAASESPWILSKLSNFQHMLQMNWLAKGETQVCPRLPRPAVCISARTHSPDSDSLILARR